jgi:hypothetical protein
MRTHPLLLRTAAFIAGFAILAFSGWAGADPPSRAARLGYMSGAVSFSPAGENDWVQAVINRPLTTGDRLWADASGRAEIQVGGAMIRMSATTGLSILNLDDRVAQLQLTQGTLTIRVRHIEPDAVFEVDTPNLAFTLRQPGAYRITANPDADATDIVVRRGEGEAYSEDASYLVDSRQAYRFYGTGLHEYENAEAPPADEFERWSSERDRIYDTSVSARYVSRDVVGYEDLDANGSWRVDPTYGNVWVPNRVAAGWTPYHEGHWAWVDPWGWTWVDDAPWGFAVSHYGRWASIGGTWCWVPGPVAARAVYAPALVAFVGGSNFQLTISGGNVGGVAWFPLAPRDVYRPSYTASRGYFDNINRSNTVINTTTITNVYNTTNVTNIVYANQHVPGAVVAVPRNAFVQSQPVAKAAVQVSRDVVLRAPVAALAPVAPTEKSVHGAAVQGDKPPARVFERPVVARTAPRAPHVGFAAQEKQLAATPGKPLDDAARKQLKPAAAAPAPVVKVISQTQTAAPTKSPPPVAPGSKFGGAGGKSDERKAPAAPAVSGTPGAPAPATPPAPAAQAPEPRGKAVQGSKEEPRGQPVTPPPAAQRGIEPKAAAPQVAPAAPATQAPPQRAGEPRAFAPQVAPPATQTPPQRSAEPKPLAPQAPPQRSAEPKPLAPQAARPAPATQTPPQRSAESSMAPPPRTAPLAPGAAPPAQREQAEPRPAPKQAEPRTPVAAPKPLAPPQAPSNAESHAQGPNPAAGKANERQRPGDEQKREEEKRKQER